MLSNATIDQLKALIDTHGGADKAAISAALDDLGRLIGTQALLARNLRNALENASVGIGAINNLMKANTLDSLLSGLSPPKRNAFTMAEAKTANEQLVAKVNSATNFSEIFKGVVEVAKVFI